jgi:dTMP kinase
VARLIAIEGIDGSGKGTQAARLVATLQVRGHAAVLFGFPRYRETFFGARIGEFLNGRFGTLADVHPFLAALLFAGDRWESRGRLQELLARYEFVVLDRYVASNIAHQAAKREGAERQVLADWIRRLEFEIYGLPPADVTILLDLPASVARTLVARKSQRDYTASAVDLQEADLKYQEQVRELYLSLCAADATWRKVSVVDSAGAVRSIEAISGDVVRAALDEAEV